MCRRTTILALIVLASPMLAAHAGSVAEHLDARVVIDATTGVLSGTGTLALSLDASPPASERGLPIVLGAGFRLVRVTIDGEPAVVREPTAPGEPWLILAGSASAEPRTITLAWEGTPQAPGDAISPRGAWLGPESAFLPRSHAGSRTLSLALALPPEWSAVTNLGPGAVDARDASVVFAPEAEAGAITLIAGPYEAGAFERDGRRVDVLLAKGPGVDRARATGIAIEASRLADALIAAGLEPRSIGLVSLAAGHTPFAMRGLATLDAPLLDREAVCRALTASPAGDVAPPWQDALCAYLVTQAPVVADPIAARDAREAFVLTGARFATEDAARALAELDPARSERERDLARAKGALVFRMIERLIGADAFASGLRALLDGPRASGWNDIASAFSIGSREDLDWLLDPWLHEPGSPSLSIARVTWTGPEGEGRAYVEARVSPGRPIPLRVRATETDGRTRDVLAWSETEDASMALDLDAGPPSLVEIDPDRDVFRRVLAAEMPPLLGDASAGPFDLVVIGTGRGRPFATRLRAMVSRWPDIAAEASVRFDVDVDREAFAAASRALVVGRPADPLWSTLAPRLPDVALDDAELAVGATYLDAQEAGLACAITRKGGGAATVLLVDVLAPETLLALPRAIDARPLATCILAEGAEPLVDVRLPAPALSLHWTPEGDRR